MGVGLERFARPVLLDLPVTTAAARRLGAQDGRMPAQSTFSTRNHIIVLITSYYDYSSSFVVPF